MTKPLTEVFHLHNDDTQHPYWDRGFLFGESVYNVIPYYQGVPYMLKEHYERFQRDLHLMKIPFSVDWEQFQHIAQEAIQKTPWPDGGLYLQATTGNTGHRIAMPATHTPSLLIVHTFAHPRPQLAQLLPGIKMISYPDNRGAYCFIKSTNRLSTRLAMLQAKEQGAVEALWFDSHTGQIHEGTSSNIFFIQDNEILTPSLSPHIFPGLTRENVLKIAEQLGLSCVVRSIHIQELRHFQGAFITGSVKQLIPIRQLDQHTYSIHPLWSLLFKTYNQHIDHYVQSQIG